MPTQNTYQLLERELPAILMPVLVFLAFIVVLFTVIILRRCCPRKEEKNEFFIEIIKLYLPHIKAKNAGILVLRQKMDRRCLDVLIVILIPIMVGIMFITFWNVYLVEESVRGDCETNFDCFPHIGGHFLQQEPVNNCSMFEFNGNVTYECYRLVFSYAEGLGAAGGILIFTAVLSKLYISLLVTIYKCMKDGNQCCRFTLYGIVWAAAVIIFILFIAISVGVPLFRETIFQTYTDQIQFAMYALSLLVIIVSGVVVAIGIEIYED